eukprot:s10135_g1.t1
MDPNAQGSGAANPFEPGTASNPASPSARSVSTPQMLELLGNILMQNQEQSNTFMAAVQAMSLEQQRQSSNLREVVSNLLEQLLKMEDLFKKYEQAANKPVPEEVKSALLLRVLPQNVKSHLTVSINDESTYDQMREVILRWERSSQKWSSQIVTGLAQDSRNTHDDGGVTHGRGQGQGQE